MDCPQVWQKLNQLWKFCPQTHVDVKFIHEKQTTKIDVGVSESLSRWKYDKKSGVSIPHMPERRHNKSKPPWTREWMRSQIPIPVYYKFLKASFNIFIAMILGLWIIFNSPSEASSQHRLGLPTSIVYIVLFHRDIQL